MNMKRILTFLIALSVLLTISVAAYAHAIPEERNDCSIEVIVRYNGEDVSGGSLTAIRIGYVAEDDGNYFFRQVMTDEVLEDIGSPDLVAILEDFYEENKDAYEFYTQRLYVEHGSATFTDLPTGLYLIIQDRSAVGYSKLNSFLVSVPYMEDGEYKYHVTAASKSELEGTVSTVPSTPSTPPPPPQTGQLNWPVPLMAVGGLAIFTFGWVLFSGKKKEQYEE